MSIYFGYFHIAMAGFKYCFEVNQIFPSIFSLVDPSNVFYCALVNFLFLMFFPLYVVLPDLFYGNVMALVNVTPCILVYRGSPFEVS
jgi:hypothetical protein